MKINSLILMLLLSGTGVAQNLDIFKNFHAIHQLKSDFYEGEGNNIFTQAVNTKLDSKGIAKLKAKYQLENAQSIQDSSLPLPNTVLINIEKKGNTFANYIYYLIPQGKKTNIISFTKIGNRNIDLERTFVKAYLSKTIPSYIYTKQLIDSIDFVGRKIKLHPSCYWLSPNNLHYPHHGHMNWSVFDDKQQAEEFRDAQFEMNKTHLIGDAVKEEWVTITFEGETSQSLRTKTKIKKPKLSLGENHYLIAYYITSKVRGKYITCVFSHYSDEESNNTLPLLLCEFIHLSE